jgi:arylsulfatase A-like enzyme
MLHNYDRHMGRILDTLQALGLTEQTDIFVVSDHSATSIKAGVYVRPRLYFMCAL